MKKIETHLHTKPVSNCAHFTPEEAVRHYHEAGYQTVFISDHFSLHHFKILGEEMTWAEKIDLMYESYLRAKAEGEKFGMHVLFSPEYSNNGNHYLLYHTTPEFLKSREDFFQMTIEEFRAYSKAWGIVIIQAHPYRDGKCTPNAASVDGFELINTNPRHENFDEKIKELVNGTNFLCSAGSDAHREEDVGRAAVLSPHEITSTAEYLDLLQSGKAQYLQCGEIVTR